METSYLYGIIFVLLAVIAALAISLILAKNKIKRFRFPADEAVPPKAEPVGIDAGDPDLSTRPSTPAVVSDAANGNELLYRQKLLNSLIDGVVLLDDKNIIAFINASMKELLGINDSFIGLSLLEAFRSEELVSLTDTIRTVGSVVGYEYEIAGLQDKYFRINGSLGEEIPSEAPYITLVFHDLTLTRQYERQRQDFVANVSHELRTPLSMISGYVETLLGGAKDNPETLEKFLTIIEKHTNRLTWLIEDLLTISSLESGGITLNFASKSIRSAVETVIDELNEKASQRKITFAIAIDDELDIFTDSGRLHQILVNLVDNALKYGYPSTTVSIKATHLKDSNFVNIDIHNLGPVIPLDVQERIFERFFRVDAARSREQGGTGLGLAIVKHLVQLHGGKVSVHSARDQGTTFSFTLPTSLPISLEA